MKIKAFTMTNIKVVILSLVLSSMFIISSCNMKANKEYKTSIELADDLFNKKEYDNSKLNYIKAAEFKPEEKYPQECISKIDAILIKKKLEDDFASAIKSGDKQFAEKDYSNAKVSFEKALSLKKGEKHSIEMIEKINELVAEIKRQEELDKYPYHIIVGCFKVESNSTKLNQKLMENGNESRIIPIAGGKYNAVSVSSYPDIRSAYNNIAQVKANFGEEVWVLNN